MQQLKLHGIRSQDSLSAEGGGAASGAAKSETAWQRRHSLVAARKNSDWADFYLSTAVTHTSMAGFLSIKNAELANEDAEYFYTYIPEAVIQQDSLYKQLLAVFNALRYWGGKGWLKEKKLLVAIYDEQAAILLKSANVKGKLRPAKVQILRGINELTQKYDLDLRVAEITGKAEDVIAFALVRSNQLEYKKRFQQMLADQSHYKQGAFVAKDQIFPPAYV